MQQRACCRVCQQGAAGKEHHNKRWDFHEEINSFVKSCEDQFIASPLTKQCPFE